MTTEIVPARNSFEPQSVTEAMQLSDLLSKSALVPAPLRGKPADIFVVLATARELGIGPMQGLSDINVIQGKPVFSADLMVAQCKRHREICKFFRLVESTDERAVYETQREGAPEPERFTFTIEDAAKLGLTGKDNYRKQPKTMLRRRAAAACAREVYPDLVRGYDPDEAEDFAKPAKHAKEASVEVREGVGTGAPGRPNDGAEVPSSPAISPPPPASEPEPEGDALLGEVEPPPSGPLEDLRQALAKATDRASLNRCLTQIRHMPDDLQIEAKIMYSLRAKEIK